MAEKMQITIVGLGLIGASAGLALKKYREKVVIVGHDKNMTLAGQARKLGAVDRTEWNLINATRGADRILLAVPPEEVHSTLEVIKEDLKDGCVIIDTASVKSQVLTWAAELLPASAGLVGGHPIFVSDNYDPAAARADLFDHKLFCLVSDARTSSSAVQIATDLIEALGAQPFFIDAAEHDGLAAGVEHLPAILAGALARATSASPAWKEMRKLAGSQFYANTFLVEGDPQAAADGCLANAQNTLRWLDAYIAELGQWRARVAAGDREGLAKDFEAGITATLKWAQAQETGNWEESQSEPVENLSMGSQFRRMLGLGGRLPRGEQKPGSQRGK